MLVGNTLAQGLKSEVNIQGSGVFIKNSDGRDIHQQATDTGGVFVGYRYIINNRLAAEVNYGYARNTHCFGAVPARVQTNLHEVSGSTVVKLPSISKVQPFALAGGGAQVFDPTATPVELLPAQRRKLKAHFFAVVALTTG